MKQGRPHLTFRVTRPFVVAVREAGVLTGRERRRQLRGLNASMRPFSILRTN